MQSCSRGEGCPREENAYHPSKLVIRARMIARGSVFLISYFPDASKLLLVSIVSSLRLFVYFLTRLRYLFVADIAFLSHSSVGNTLTAPGKRTPRPFALGEFVSGSLGNEASCKPHSKVEYRKFTTPQMRYAREKFLNFVGSIARSKFKAGHAGKSYSESRSV